MKRKGKTLNLSTESAAHALHALIAVGKIAASDVTNALKRREQMIHDLRQKLVALEGGLMAGAGRKLARRVRPPVP